MQWDEIAGCWLVGNSDGGMFLCGSSSEVQGFFILLDRKDAFKFSFYLCLLWSLIVCTH